VLSVLSQWLVDRVRAMSADGPYRPPTDDERAAAVAVLVDVLAGGPGGERGADEVTGRPFTMVVAASHWGVAVVQGPPELVIEVPHPGSDRLTSRLGLELFRAFPTAALLVAGAHRNAADGAADVAHRADSLFHAYAQALAVPELQVHGFAATSAPDTDAVISPGAGQPTDWHRAMEKSLTQHGFRVRHHEHLAGRTNVQGIAAASAGRPFLHLELAPLVRRECRDLVVDAASSAWHQHRDQDRDDRGARRDQERHPEPGQ
jgi:hypothetical protein